ncbi:MAG: hypothetical protein AXW12_08710 [Thalassospira sp. Nap_22]|nr:MAG: hypothetical protein AXW12_08710 [Thalassospira sp. Nap_22]
MIIYEITNTEDHPVYRELEVSNGTRQYSFLNSIMDASLQMKRPYLSQNVIKSLNFHAITCLHITAGEYRPWGVVVGEHEPPLHFRVQALMDDFVNTVNRSWENTDPVSLATYVLWRLNHIHPFVNGNGRTARAACYFVLCLKLEKFPQGETILPERIKQNRDEYCAALKHADDTLKSGKLDLTLLHNLVTRLIQEQLEEAEASLAASSAEAKEVPQDSEK